MWESRCNGKLGEVLVGVPLETLMPSNHESLIQPVRNDSACDVTTIELDSTRITASTLSTSSSISRMQLCTCFANVPVQRSNDVMAWLDGRPWHVLTPRQQEGTERCGEDCAGCVLASVRSTCERLLELDENLFGQLLENIVSILFPQVCWQTRENDMDEEGFVKLYKLLQACAEPLESRLNIATVLARRLRNTLLGLLGVAEGDIELTHELQLLLVALDSSALLSPRIFEEQRVTLSRLIDGMLEARRRDFRDETMYRVYL